MKGLLRKDFLEYAFNLAIEAFIIVIYLSIVAVYVADYFSVTDPQSLAEDASGLFEFQVILAALIPGSFGYAVGMGDKTYKWNHFLVSIGVSRKLLFVERILFLGIIVLTSFLISLIPFSFALLFQIRLGLNIGPSIYGLAVTFVWAIAWGATSLIIGLRTSANVGAVVFSVSLIAVLLFSFLSVLQPMLMGQSIVDGTLTPFDNVFSYILTSISLSFALIALGVSSYFLYSTYFERDLD